MGGFVTGSREIAAAPSTVWAILADVERWPERLTPHLKSAALHGPLETGTKGSEPLTIATHTRSGGIRCGSGGDSVDPSPRRRSEAQRLSESGHTRGKIVLVPSQRLSPEVRFCLDTRLRHVGPSA